MTMPPTLVQTHLCDTPTCESVATTQVVERGRHLSWHCDDCFALIDLILEETSRMVKLGTPRDIAADWASAAVAKIA